MHELAIAQSLLDIIVEEGKKRGITRVITVRLQVGALSAVVPESLTFCFELVSSGTIAAGAKIEIETTPVVARCSECNLDFEIKERMFVCPRCGKGVSNLVSGRELSIVNMECETGDDDDPD